MADSNPKKEKVLEIAFPNELSYYLLPISILLAAIIITATLVVVIR